MKQADGRWKKSSYAREHTCSGVLISSNEERIVHRFLKTHFTTLLLLLCSMASADEAYLVTSRTEVRIGNGAVERVFTLQGAQAGTTAILNKLSGVRVRITSEEFALSIVFAGFGPAAGKEQNGENPSVLTAKDFRFTGTKEQSAPDGSRTLTLLYSFDRYQASLRVAVHYVAYPGVPYT